jgi:MSHA pilin protein MshC
MGQKGFTLVELIVTMIVVGILAAVILPRWNGSSGFDERAFRDRVAAGLRYAQKSAIAARRTTCATFTATAVTFSISSFGAANCTGGVPLVGPDGASLITTATNSASFSTIPSDVVFDAAGRPTSGAGTLSFTGLPADLNVTIEAETGYVH